jgi:hypothetical protein
MTAMPRRIKAQAGRNALVDGIPFRLPVDSVKTGALMAAFRIDPVRAAAMLPGNELHPFRLGSHALLVVTVVNYRFTDIGRYVEFSIAIACTHGGRPAPPLLPAVFRRWFGTGQFVVDLPVSTEISVKGGKGIWGMPKHQANLDFEVTDRVVSSQYDKDGMLGMRIEIDRPGGFRIPLDIGAINYCQFRGMLMKSAIYFKGHMQVGLGGGARARLYLGDNPRVQPLKDLRIDPKPIFTAYLADVHGALDDHFEAWFLSSAGEPPQTEGMESVFGLGLGQDWLDPPKAPYGDDELVR